MSEAAAVQIRYLYRSRKNNGKERACQHHYQYQSALIQESPERQRRLMLAETAVLELVVDL
ncbi:MAG: hypothetical protein BMS9Abin37_2406 [Acidobacteriota bacterium]|nr:MAG: hypothetical protein BMS9Abin37_2406 [Acidobacteriota bacterium]